MTSLNVASQGSDKRGWNRSISPRVAQTGIVLIVAAVALLGLVSINVGTNSDALRSGATTAADSVIRTW